MSQPPLDYYWYRAYCKEVVDGDTITILTDLGFRIGWEQRVRLYGIDTYELNNLDPVKRELALKGKKYVLDRIWERDIIVNTHKDKADKYGRWLCIVWYQNEEQLGTWYNLNEELVREGLAIKYLP